MKPTSKKIRTAIIGYGAVAPFYFRAIKKSKALDLILVCDIDDIKSPSGVKKIDNYKDVSKYDIDLVFICTPPYTHLDLISYFSAKGINVVIEKPMVISNNELDKVKKLNQKYKSYIIPVYHSSYNPLVNYAKKIISNNKIFKVEANCIENALSFHPKSLNWLFDKKKSGGGVIMLGTR